MKNLFLIQSLAILLLINCNFGSIGNSLDEKQTILNSIFTTLIQTKGIVYSNIFILDDRADKNLGEFKIISNKVDYSIYISGQSYFYIDKLEYVLIPTTGLFNIQKKEENEYQIMHHLNEDSSSFGQVINSENFNSFENYLLTNFIQSNYEDEEGYAYKTGIQLNRNISQGIINKLTIHIFNISLKGYIKKENISKNFEFDSGDIDISIPTKCNNKIQLSKPNLSIFIGLKIHRMFQDNASGSIVDSIFQKNGNVIVSNKSNSDIYNLFVNNLENNQVITEYKCDE